MGKRYCFQGTLTDNSGNIVPNATVTVYVCEDDETEGSLATIYAAKTGGSPVGGSQVTTDTDGFWKFYVDDETYPVFSEFNLKFEKAGMTTTWRKSVR